MYDLRFIFDLGCLDFFIAGKDRHQGTKAPGKNEFVFLSD
jgi:hypothetical protein